MIEHDGRIRKGLGQRGQMRGLMKIVPGIEGQAHLGQHRETGTEFRVTVQIVSTDAFAARQAVVGIPRRDLPYTAEQLARLAMRFEHVAHTRA